ITGYMIREWLLDAMDRKRAFVVTAGTHGSGMKVFRHITQRADDEFGSEAVEGVKAVMRIMSVFIMVSIFWALFDQHASSWIRQAEMMNRKVYFPFLGDIELLSSQIPSLNPVMVMMLIPIWAYLVEPALKKIGIVLSPLK